MKILTKKDVTVILRTHLVPTSNLLRSDTDSRDFHFIVFTEVPVLTLLLYRRTRPYCVGSILGVIIDRGIRFKRYSGHGGVDCDRQTPQ